MTLPSRSGVQTHSTLSIDLGSETTRISLSFEKVDRKNRVQKDVIHVRPQQYRTLDSKPDWLSLCNVLDRGTPYIGNGDIKRPKSTTMKLAIAWATDADDESLRDCPLMSVFREIEAKGPQEVISAKRRVKQACLLLFRKIDARTQAICEAHDIRIDSFVLTIPSHWKMKVEEYYESIIREAFGSEDNTDVHFLREVEADAHYLFHDEHACRTMIKTRLDNYKQCKFLIVDFGGFSFNAIIYHVERSDDGRLCYASDGEACGVTGGSAHFSHLFSEACIHKTERQLGRPLDDATLQAIEIDFDRRKIDGTINDTSSQSFELREASTGMLIRLDFDATELYFMWSTAHAGPLDLFGKMVKRLTKMKSPGSSVVVSGGSARHEFLKSALKQVCATSNVPESNLTWTDDIEAVNPDSRLTVGMPCALEEMISVYEYFERGGAWGIVRTQSVGKHNIWDSLPKILWTKDFRDIEIDFSSDGLIAALLVGTPFGNINTREDLLPTNNYIMLELDIVPAGDYIFSLRYYEDAAGRDILKFSISGAEPQRLAEVKLPVRYDMGSNCVLYDVPEEELNKEWERVYQILATRTKDLASIRVDVDVMEDREAFRRDPDFKAGIHLQANSRYAPTARMQTRAKAKRPRPEGVDEAVVPSRRRRQTNG